MAVRRYQPSPDDERFMALAIELAAESVQESRDDGRPSPKVGVVAVKGGEVVATGFRGQGGPGDHGEWSLIKSLGDEASAVLKGSTIYTTLEPCTTRSPGRTPCSNHLIEMRVARVFIGTYDPHPRVHRLGWRRLRDAGIDLCDFTATARAEAEALLEDFRGPYVGGSTATNCAEFDFSQNDGRYPIDADGVRFETRWGGCGDDSVYAIFRSRHLAHALHAENFDQVDDPGGYHFDGHSKRIAEGEIAIFREGPHFLLVEVLEVVPGPSRGAEYTSLKIEWQTRTGEQRPHAQDVT